MQNRMGTCGELVGRERELAAVETFLAGTGGAAAALLLEGPPGIGKTSIWESAVAAARTGVRTLVARPSAEEKGLGFSGLSDLFHAVEPTHRSALPLPQRQALDAALLLDDDGGPVSSRAVAAAVLSIFRSLAGGGPVLVAIDDLQWLDDSTQAALAYAARRLAPDDVRFLLTLRTGTGESPGPLDLVLRPDAEVVAVTPLSLGATGRLLQLRLGVAFPRPTLQRIFDTSAGNPLFALELARLIERSGGRPDSSRDLPLPDRIEAALADHLATLDPPAERALLAAALGGSATVSELSAVVGADSLAAASSAGVVAREGDRARPSHPLLGAVATARAQPAEVRELHRALAAATTDEERSVRHLALAQDQADEEVARIVAAAARRASRRGSATTASELSTHALRLTPPTSPARDERMLDAADHWFSVGDIERVRALLERAIAELPPGPLRVRALVRLTFAIDSDTEAVSLLARAIEEAGDDASLRAQAMTQRAFIVAVGFVERLTEALDQGEEAARIARSAGDQAIEAEALGNLMWFRHLRGLDSADLMTRYREIESDARIDLYDSADRALGVRHIWRGEPDDARRVLGGARALADERGEEVSSFLFRLHLCETELRAGGWDAAAAILEEWEVTTTGLQGDEAALARCRALLAVGRGAADAAELADGALELALRRDTWQWLESRRAAGVAALLAGRPGDAAEHLDAVWQHTQREGVEDPGAFPVAPDLVEALVATGRVAEARTVAARLRALAEAQIQPWGLAASDRADGVVLVAEREPEAADGLLTAAAERFGELGLSFDRARTLLALAGARRQAKRIRAGREAAREAEQLFAAIGSPGWAERTRLELARFGGRQSTSGLTQAEERVAELVRRGLTNKEVAAELMITVSAVERHLTRIYSKLGVRSRTELAAH
ncbi:MAG TPA: AAA family ATPase [Gaiellaceae bacterium]|nr:AAA family ATPase [Gaiellaceae bacterium]